jgi:hypothetical protein
VYVLAFGCFAFVLFCLCLGCLLSAMWFVFIFVGKGGGGRGTFVTFNRTIWHHFMSLLFMPLNVKLCLCLCLYLCQRTTVIFFVMSEDYCRRTTVVDVVVSVLSVVSCCLLLSVAHAIRARARRLCARRLSLCMCMLSFSLSLLCEREELTRWTTRARASLILQAVQWSCCSQKPFLNTS